MDVRAVFAEVLAITMTIIYFINIFLNIYGYVWLRITTFLIFVLLGYQLIKGVLRESRQKEELASLNDKLAQKVMEQTAEIRHALELEKNSRRELEKLNETKNQFILITQHNLRAPTQNVRSQIEIVKADSSHLGAPAIHALERAENATKRLTNIVDDFLAITELKPGSAILDIKQSSMLPLINDVLKELELEIDSRNLKITYPSETKFWPEVEIDAVKIREVLLIVLENAVKYNHEGGHIGIQSDIRHESFSVIIENSGIGISEDELDSIGKTTFFRGKEARNHNHIGMGVGLNVAKAIVRAHHGELNISSKGREGGAKVVIDLKTNFILT
jgi:signal transduction histidine kinase